MKNKLSFNFKADNGANSLRLISVWILLLFLVVIKNDIYASELILDTRPACNSYCDDIVSLLILTDEVKDKRITEHSKFLENELRKVLIKYKYDNKIKIQRIGHTSNWHQHLTNIVQIQLSFYEYRSEVVSSNDQVSIGLLYLTPSGAHSEVFLCPGSRNEGVVDENFYQKYITRFVDSWVDLYLFQKGIVKEKVKE